MSWNVNASFVPGQASFFIPKNEQAEPAAAPAATTTPTPTPTPAAAPESTAEPATVDATHAPVETAPEPVAEEPKARTLVIGAPAEDKQAAADKEEAEAKAKAKAEAEAEAKAKAEAEAAAKAKQEAENEEEDEDDEEREPIDPMAGMELDPRDHFNVVFIGHVDAGKSTISGNVLYLTGQVDQRIIDKYTREAQAANRASWFLAYIMDTSEEERAKGKTVEVGRAHFETENRRYTILDAPGHKNYVPNMISGAAQADVGILVISARKNEFEAGFDHGGQTREHAMLAKTLGVRQLVVVINKMDDKTVKWASARYEQIKAKLEPFLKKLGYNLKQHVHWLPISGYTGENIKVKVEPEVCPWYEGGSTLLEVLDELKPPDRDPNGPLRIPVIDKYRDMGSVVLLGKVECGTVKPGDTVTLMPNDNKLEVLDVSTDLSPVPIAGPGENVRLRVKGVDEGEVSSGFVVCSPESPIGIHDRMEAQIVVLELPTHKPILSAGYECVMHIHTAQTEIHFDKLVTVLDKKTKKQKKNPPFVNNGAVLTARIILHSPLCIETFKDQQQLGRFTLRDEGKTIAIGKVLRLRGSDNGPSTKSAVKG